MRTDSTNVAPAAQAEARQVIDRLYGAEALPARPPVYSKKVKNAQEAHEAIRPTKPDRLPKDIRDALTPDQDKLYTLVWRRFIASQMKPALYNVTTVTVNTARDGAPLPYIFRATGRQLLDPGFLRVYDLDEEPAEEDTALNEQLPPLARGDKLECHKLIPEQHFTKPPPYFTDATLIQELERLGIGRPSTFASIVDTLYQRDYVGKAPTGRGLSSTELGRVVCDFLVTHFPSVFEVGFTARLEDQLDDIANGQAEWTAVMANLWGPLSALIAQTQAAIAGQPKIRVPAQAAPAGGGGPDDDASTAPKWRGKGKSWGKGGARRSRGSGQRAKRGEATARRKAVADGSAAVEGEASAPRSVATPRSTAMLTGQTCPQCGKPLVSRTSKYGPFVGCSGYPKCRYIAKQDKSPGL